MTSNKTILPKVLVAALALGLSACGDDTEPTKASQSAYNMDILLQASIALFAAALTAHFAVKTYFRRREHELILSRYLEGCLDLLGAEISTAYETFNQNLARCLQILKDYRDLQDDFSLEELDKGFYELFSAKHNLIAQYRLHTLVDSPDYWKVYQHAMSCFEIANTKIAQEIPQVIRTKNTTEKIPSSPEEIFEEMRNTAIAQNEKASKHLDIIREFQLLSHVLERSKYRFKNLKKFKEEADVKKSVARTKELLVALES